MSMEIKDKPQSMSVREWIIRKIAQETMIPERTIKQVVAHNYDTAYEAVSKFNSIEISGFGKFYYNTKKAIREKERLLAKKQTCEELLDSDTATEKERLTAERDIKQIVEHIIAIEKKL